ncbi:MAG TPA: 4,5-DOPA dioxygenase extradiol [Gemmatimonadales bacterium]
MSSIFPAVFLGHGSPMNAIETNAYTQAWRAIGEQLGKPRAIVSISAHWYLGATAVTVGPKPRTIHDFGGFPPELYQVQYPAPGDDALGTRLAELLAPVPVTPEVSWGLDHGTWSVLRHMYPKADVPIVQLSLDATQPASFHHALGRALSPLRSERVLILGSGNVVHNLGVYSWDRGPRAPYDWAIRFERVVRETIGAGDHQPLVDYERLGADASWSVPTPEHYLPLLYVLGSRQADEPATFPVSGIEGGSISMLAVQLGAT